jgi:uncharacterized integral membrane protein
MSTATDDPGSARPIEEPEKHPGPRKRDQARTLALVIVAVLITIFAVLNTRQVKVEWIVGSGKAPLIIVIVISLLVGIVLTHFAERRVSKRR